MNTFLEGSNKSGNLSYTFVIFLSSTFSFCSIILSNQYFLLHIDLLFNLELTVVIPTFGLKSTRREAEKIKEEKEGSNIYCVPSIFQVFSVAFWAHSYILCSYYGLHLAVEETETWRDYDLSKVTDIVRGSAVI